MANVLPVVRSTSQATRMLVSTRSLADLAAPRSSRNFVTDVTQMPSNRIPVTDISMMRGPSPNDQRRRAESSGELDGMDGIAISEKSSAVSKSHARPIDPQNQMAGYPTN